MEFRVFRLTFAAISAFFMQIGSTSGAMFVYPMEVPVGLKGASQIKVISQDNDVQFIKVSLKQIFQPGTAQENEKASDASSAAGLIITPQKIALSPASERVVRLVSVLPPKKETTWRAYFKSVNEESFITPRGDLKRNTATASIGVNVVWGVLIHVAPEEVQPSLTFIDGNGKILNNGTIRIPVKEVGSCKKSGQCQWIKVSATIYPDTEVSLPGIKFSHDKEYRIKYVNWITGKTEEISLSR
ncbi:fimbrial protein [Enterobacter cloacae]|uniref:Fimbrial protein n=1 Tax=Enterobacter cloacae TaxID=550 RepID=A0A3R9A066_ENTCL|nr:fimbrial protein [Enterobacter cloacae]MBF4114181.1 fimbrial protein [Enterobacter cloacae]RSB24436.1 fimbrial protein [Enterobacter cloacae]